MIGPNDLIAFVTFDGHVYANQAVTRERLGQPPESAHALKAALAHWMRRRHVWLEVEGRRIQGIATARPLAAPTAWEIDTLVDASDPGAEETVVRSLLQQAQQDALDDEVTHLLVRLRANAPAVVGAMRAGFTQALGEQLWRAPVLRGLAVANRAITVEMASDADEHDLFMLYNRAVPVSARSAIAMTHREWRATREDHWLSRRSTSFVARAEGQIIGSARIAAARDRTNIELLTAPEASGAAGALLAAVAPLCKRGQPVLALAPAVAGSAASELRASGFEPDEEFAVLSKRMARPVEETVTVSAGVAVPGG
ncbi:MAG: hypothetical protein F4X80_05030 [Chloroflexi bacterium]|nr:hypothetical protein [Chloroflexota bacterium]